MNASHLVSVPGGSVAYETLGNPGSPALLLLPSMGDTRAQYRLVAPRFAALGYHVIVADLRGLGESTAGFTGYSVQDLANDALAILDHAGVARATVLGSSLSGATAVMLAAQHPSRINALALVGAVTRDQSADKYMHALLGVLFARWWGARFWAWFYKTLFKKHSPADLEAHRVMLRAHLSEPGRLRSVIGMGRASKAPAHQLKSQVQCPSLVLMGTRDPDFKNPTAEAELLKQELGDKSTMELYEGVGHYPHLEIPEEMVASVHRWLLAAGIARNEDRHAA